MIEETKVEVIDEVVEVTGEAEIVVEMGNKEVVRGQDLAKVRGPLEAGSI